MYICVIVFCCYSSLSIKDERRQASSLVCGFVRKVDFGHDFEQQLSFYVDVRGNFSNLDTVLIFLVQVRGMARSSCLVGRRGNVGEPGARVALD